jgi:hypothetical protein
MDGFVSVRGGVRGDSRAADDGVVLIGDALTECGDVGGLSLDGDG